jgi:molybdopterin-containing oxidoreductase family membrane subunit
MAVVATFAYEDDFLAAAEKLKSSGIDDIELLSPLPLEEAYEILGLGKSPVRRFSLAGAIIGAASGFAMCVATALVFILPTGGRAIIALPPYLVITYEMTILLGVLFTLIGFHAVSGLPAWHDKPYLPEANIDRFVVVVDSGSGEQIAQAESIIRQAGAEDIRHVEVG